MPLQARIDSHNKILYARHADQRNATFQRALQTGNEFDRDVKSMLLRINLFKHESNQKQSKKSWIYFADNVLVWPSLARALLFCHFHPHGWQLVDFAHLEYPGWKNMRQLPNIRWLMFCISAVTFISCINYSDRSALVLLLFFLFFRVPEYSHPLPFRVLTTLPSGLERGTTGSSIGFFWFPFTFFGSV